MLILLLNLKFQLDIVSSCFILDHGIPSVPEAFLYFCVRSIHTGFETNHLSALKPNVNSN